MSDKSAMKNIKENIPPKARLMMAAIVIVGFSLAAYVMFFVFSSSEEKVGPAASVSQIAQIASDSSVKAPDFQDKSNVIPGSLMEKKLDQARESDIEKAKSKSGGGYMDPVILPKDAEVKQDDLDLMLNAANNRVDRKINDLMNHKDTPTGADDVIKPGRDRAKDEEIRRLTAQRSGQAGGAQGQKTQGYAYRYDIKSYDQFLNEEKQRLTTMESTMKSNTLSLLSEQRSQFQVDSGSDRSKASQETGQTAPQSEVDYLTSIMTPASKLPKPDYSALSAVRGKRPNTESVTTVAPPVYPDFYGNEVEQAVSEIPAHTVGDMCLAILDFAVNTDKPGPIKARIIDPSCKANKTVLVAEQAAVVGEAVQISFSKSARDGRSASINAIGLELDSFETYFADEVDTHFLFRWSSLVGSALLPGIRDSVTEETQASDSNGNVSKVSKIDGSFASQSAVVLGAIGDAIAPALVANFNRAPTIKVYRNKLILVMFMDDWHLPE